MRNDELLIWTVYDHPRDYPAEWIARCWTIRDGQPAPTTDIRRGPTLDAVRALLPPGLFRLDRQPGDEPQIVETWL